MCIIWELLITKFMLVTCVIPELYRIESFYFCLIFAVAVVLILLSCTISEAANLPDFFVGTEVFGCTNVNPVALLLWVLMFSHGFNQEWCCVFWPWLLSELFLALKGMRSLDNSECIYPATQHVDSLSRFLFWKEPPLLIFCWFLHNCTLLTAGMFLLFIDTCGPTLGLPELF
jgi:hypothetical protein